ncbi:LysR family transcriptional regulator [Thalassotalea sp. 1_MG-2023]|uniref:LysR family transcriptional regulator n=1 Tax=Thalassotalea sp. 1_MG-2023 TaxID=3062680 RepID=UPI0026E3737B|nr:LysR family transcriptional regulator [Thalassotalea sp. 1_MG-2023]MDO6428334.1 LysR family transcriptional regulator [Thalassotalea sp. 1_MG-2023]
MLNPNWLKTFVTLIDTGHFTKAAQKLYMTQPGVSQHIRKLEEACEHQLIRRDKKSFDITEQGRLIYDYAKQLYKNEQQILEQLTFDDPFSGKCTLACSGALALILYPKLLTIQCRYTALIMQLKAAPNEQILTEVESGEVDLGLVTDVQDRRMLDVQKVGQEQLCLVVPADINTDDEVDTEDTLMRLGLISHPDATHYLTRYFAQNDQLISVDFNVEKIPVTGYVNQISQILAPVASGLGFTVLPKSAVDSFNAREQLKVLETKKHVVETLYIVKKRGRSLPKRFDLIKTMLGGYFEKSVFETRNEP